MGGFGACGRAAARDVPRSAAFGGLAGRGYSSRIARVGGGCYRPAPMQERFEQELAQDLAAIKAQGLDRALRCVDAPQGRRIVVDGQGLLNFSSNDYLGLANHPLLKEAAIRAVERFGAGAGASRLICGSLTVHHELDEALASFKGVEAALSFSSGYAAAVGAICALVGADDIIVLDRLVHACIVDAARLSGAKLRVFAHNDLESLETILAWAERRLPKSGSASASRRPRVLIVTESVFSMDGDHAPLREIVDLKERHGAWLMLDEAHATGLYGQARRGLAEAAGVSERVEIQMGTLGKALGASGGYICGRRALIELLVNRARTFIFSTAPVPAAAAAARAGVELIVGAAGAERCAKVWKHVEELSAMTRPWLNLAAEPSTIIPLLIGAEQDAVQASARLRSAGLFVPAIRYPTVARGKARLRVTLTAAHTPEDIKTLAGVLEDAIRTTSK